MSKVGVQYYPIKLRYDEQGMPQAAEWISSSGWILLREKDGTLWYDIHFIRQDCIDILKHFGLENFEDEFNNERILSMSPAQLVRERRKKEEEHSLPHITGIIKDRFAEEFDWQ